MSQRTIWKYDIPIANSFPLEMPRSADILSIKTQHGKPQLWALVDPNPMTNPYELRHFAVVGTGEDAEHVRPEFYLGTFLLPGDSEVYHLFELPYLKP